MHATVLDNHHNIYKACGFVNGEPYTAISIKVAPEQSGEVEYERERLLGIAKNSLIF